MDTFLTEVSHRRGSVMWSRSCRKTITAHAKPAIAGAGHIGRLLRRAYRMLKLPVDDYFTALTACLTRFNVLHVLSIAAAFAVAWWVYVPIHELLHAYGCLLTGGEVTRLEIDPLYGAALLQQIFPFVAVGSSYAGQLTGFDTHNNDLTYLATDFLPFTLTILIGIPLLRWVATDRQNPLRGCIALGAAIPVAYAPFISIPGDYYEMGSILVSRLVALWSPSLPLARWRSDDLFKLVGELFFSDAGASVGDAAGVLASSLVGIVLAFVTYWIGAQFARLVVRDQSR